MTSDAPVKRGKGPVRFRPDWLHNSYASIAVPFVIVVAGIDALLAGLYFLASDARYVAALAVISSAGGLGGAIVLLLLPKGWHGCWSLTVLYEDPKPVENSERLWAAVLEAFETNGIRYSRPVVTPRRKNFGAAHDPIEILSEGMRLWFDNSPPPTSPESTVIRVVLTLQPIEERRDPEQLKRLVVDALVREEGRQRQIRLGSAGKA